MSGRTCIDDTTNSSICMNISSAANVASLSERDIAYTASADQTFLPGADLNTMIFQTIGYTYPSTTTVSLLLEDGLQSLFLDIWWSPKGFWQLCPAPFPQNATVGTYNLTSMADGSSVLCDNNATFADVLSSVETFISQTDTNLAVNLLTLTVRPRMFPSYMYSNTSNTTPSDMAVSFQNDFGAELASRALSPSDLQTARSEGDITYEATNRNNSTTAWPTLNYVLLTLRKRVVVLLDQAFFTISDDATISFPINPPGTNDIPGIFQPTDVPLEGNLSDDQYTSISSQPFRFVEVADEQNAVSLWRSVIYGGYSPVLNTTMSRTDLLTVLQQGWAWAYGSPASQSYNDRIQLIKDQQLDMCAIQTSNGWLVNNCKDNFNGVCKSKTASFSWLVTDDRFSYFDYNCPDRYAPDSPKTPLQARKVKEITGYQTVWIDMNSLSLPDCWIKGGQYATCPYNIIEGDTNGVAVLSVAAAVAAIMLGLMFMLEWDNLRLPLRHRNVTKNRKRMRKPPPAHVMDADGIAT